MKSVVISNVSDGATDYVKNIGDKEVKRIFAAWIDNGLAEGLKYEVSGLF